MSSTMSTEYSPTSNYSYPADVSLSPPAPSQPSRSYSDQVPPPRLSSPHIFRNIFSTEATGPSARSPPRLPPLHEINFAETMQDVNRALQSANRAIQTAHEAFQSRRTTSADNNRRQDVVDLTNSPPAPATDENPFDSFLTRTLHPHDSLSNTRSTNPSLNEPFYPGASSSANTQTLFVEEDDPTSRYAGQSDSLAGARRRYEAHRERHRRHMAIPHIQRSLYRSSFAENHRHEEEEAIRRQTIARATWEQNQLRLQEQRARLLARTESQIERVRSQVQNQTQSQSTSQNTTASGTSGVSYSRSYSSPARAMSPSSSSVSSVEAVDLTAVNGGTDLAAALVQSQSKNPISDPTHPDTSQPRSALTAYKCPICLEPPRNATTTICGHLFCHECILETLKNSENMRREEAAPHRKVKGQCPVCRKELARKEEEGLSRTLVPLEIKLVSKKRMAELRRLEKKRTRHQERSNDQKQNLDKGKGKEKADDDDNIAIKKVFELSSGDEDDGRGKKTKRVKLSKSEELDEELFGAFINTTNESQF